VHSTHEAPWSCQLPSSLSQLSVRFFLPFFICFSPVTMVTPAPNVISREMLPSRKTIHSEVV